jgi:hypothetical protein
MKIRIYPAIDDQILKNLAKDAFQYFSVNNNLNAED